MQLTVAGKQVEIGSALKSHVEAALAAILGKYFRTAIEAHVVFGKEAHLDRADISIRVGRGILVNAGAEATGFYAAFDAAAERLGKQLRRYKRRLRDHHAKQREEPAEFVRSYILAPPDEADHESDAIGGPAVIAEMSTELPNLTVGEAAMRMDLAGMPVLLFRNRSHGELNLVYRRGDGNIGWIDPSLDRGRRTGNPQA